MPTAASERDDDTSSHVDVLSFFDDAVMMTSDDSSKLDDIVSMVHKYKDILLRDGWADTYVDVVERNNQGQLSESNEESQADVLKQNDDAVVMALQNSSKVIDVISMARKHKSILSGMESADRPIDIDEVNNQGKPTKINEESQMASQDSSKVIDVISMACKHKSVLSGMESTDRPIDIVEVNNQGKPTKVNEELQGDVLKKIDDAVMMASQDSSKVHDAISLAHKYKDIFLGKDNADTNIDVMERNNQEKMTKINKEAQANVLKKDDDADMLITQDSSKVNDILSISCTAIDKFWTAPGNFVSHFCFSN